VIAGGDRDVTVVPALRSFRAARLSDVIAFGADRARIGARVVKDDLVRFYEIEIARLAMRSALAGVPRMRTGPEHDTCAASG
jgi:recombinational DNA repair ATPase RecF